MCCVGGIDDGDDDDDAGSQKNLKAWMQVQQQESEGLFSNTFSRAVRCCGSAADEPRVGSVCVFHALLTASQFLFF